MDGRLLTSRLSRRVAASVQHVALSLLREEQAKVSYYIPLGMFTSNSTKLNSVPIIAYNSNVHFARNVPFSQTRSHITITY